MYLVLALLLQSTPTPAEPVLPSKAEIVEAYDQVAALITDILNALPSRLGVRADRPYLGFTMRTDEMGIGPNGLPQRHTFVESVFRGTPAFDAGIRPGDRIAAIGPIECDTLKLKAVSFYMGEYPDTVPLSLERAGKRLTVSVRRSPLPCAALVWQRFPVALWSDRLMHLQLRVGFEQSAIIAEEEQLTAEQTIQAIIAYNQTADLVARALSEMSNQLNPARSPLCEVEK